MTAGGRAGLAAEQAGLVWLLSGTGPDGSVGRLVARAAAPESPGLGCSDGCWQSRDLARLPSGADWNGSVGRRAAAATRLIRECGVALGGCRFGCSGCLPPFGRDRRIRRPGLAALGRLAAGVGRPGRSAAWDSRLGWCARPASSGTGGAAGRRPSAPKLRAGHDIRRDFRSRRVRTASVPPETPLRSPASAVWSRPRPVPKSHRCSCPRPKPGGMAR